MPCLLILKRSKTEIHFLKYIQHGSDLWLNISLVRGQSLKVDKEWACRNIQSECVLFF